MQVQTRLTEALPAAAAQAIARLEQALVAPAGEDELALADELDTIADDYEHHYRIYRAA